MKLMKGIAVPYIIAILLGVAVIGLIGYWLFFSGGRIGKADCEIAQREWCTLWKTVDSTYAYTDENNPGIRPVQPAGYPSGCATVKTADCKKLLG